jgi:enoyl-[acyl-carrier protein] reductase II
MKTRITELFEIKYPILLSGMSWISVPELVAAIANAGGLGILATGVVNAQQTREYVRKTRDLTDKPFAANVTLYFPGAERNAEILIEEKVPVINYSLGKGDWIAKAVHDYGGKVIATVTTHRHALSAQRHGADALIVTGHEAAGHGGDVTSLVLIPSIVDAVDIPVIAAGGFADGRGLAAAIALGAQGISMGTRLMNTVESPVHEVQKKMSTEREVYDTVYTTKVDGLPARFMKSRGSAKIMKQKLNPFSVLFRSRHIAQMLGFPWFKLALGILSSGYKNTLQMAQMAIGFEKFRTGTIDGDNETGVLPLGQITGLVKDTPTVAEVIERVMSEAQEVMERMSSKIK